MFFDTSAYVLTFTKRIKNIMYKYLLETIKYIKPIQFLFLIIWCFFILRISSPINWDENFIKFDFSKLFIASKDVLSFIIFFCFLAYLLINTYKTKKISPTSILIMYPILSLVGYYFSEYKNVFQEGNLLHHFITLISVFLYFSFIQSNKIFDYKFKELLLKIVLVFFITYTLLIIVPDIALKISSYEGMRILQYNNVFTFFGQEISLNQNVNGQTKFLFVIEVLSFILFKKYFFKNKIISYSFFLIGLLILILIYMMQARLNILASFIFIFFLIFTFKKLDLKRKIIYLLIIVALPPLCFNFYTDTASRFRNVGDITPQAYDQAMPSAETQQDRVALFIQERDSIKNLVFDLLNRFSNETNKHNGITVSEVISGKILTQVTRENKIQNISPLLLIKMNSELKTLSKKLKAQVENINNEIEIYSELNDIIFRSYLELKQTAELTKSKLYQMNEGYNIIPSGEFRILVIKVGNQSDAVRDYIFSNCTTLRKIDGLLGGRICGWELLLKTTTTNSLFFGKGFFADRVYLKPVWKVASNSWVNIFNNAGIFSLLILVSIILFFLIKFFKIKNFQHKNILISLSNYLIFYLIVRSMFEDSMAFVSFDFLLLGSCMILIKEKESLKKISF